MQSKNGALLAHNPDEGITDYELENMMQHFIDEEEYEKAQTALMQRVTIRRKISKLEKQLKKYEDTL